MTRKFGKWAKKEHISSRELAKSLIEVINGQFDANLGGYIYKKRIARSGQGKSGGLRSLICFKQGDRAVFIHGFSKSGQENISSKELKALKELAGILFNMNNKELKKALMGGALLEVRNG